MENKSKFKILTSIIMLLFFIAIFNNSYAVSDEDWDKVITACDNNNNFQNYIANYDNVLLLFARYGYQYGSSGLAFVFNGDNINFSSSEIYKNGEYISYNITDKRFCEFRINRSTGLGQVDAYEGGWYTSQSSSFVGSFSTPQEAIIDRSYSYKGNFTVTYDNDPIIEPERQYDFSFVINNHTFDFTMEDFTFSNGVTLTSDTLKEGQFVASLYVFNCNNYGNDFINYWASGYIDYFPYSDVDPKKQFYFSTGYETLKLYNGSNDNDVYYRFYFKGYSNDSSVANFDNNIITSGVNNYSQWNKYSPVKDSTFLYSNHDIYWATDTSLYGFNGFTNNLWYNESLDSVTVKNTNENIIESEDPEQDSNVYALNNNVYNSSSTSPVITNSNLYGFSGSSYGDLETYSKTEEFTGANTQGVDTSNWTTLDYVKHIPQAIADLPLNIIKGAINLIIPSSEDLKECFDFFNKFAEERLGILYAPISFITDFLENLSDKYTSSFSVYNFTIPRNSLV